VRLSQPCSAAPSQEILTPCLDRIRTGSFATSTFSQFGVHTSGFGGGGEPGVTPATVAWTVGGVSATGTSGTVDVPVDEVTFTVEYTIDPVVFELALTSRGGERFETPVVVTVTGGGTTATASAIFTAQGWLDGIHPEDLGTLGRCLAEISDRYHVVPGPFRKPTPNPPWATLSARRQAEQLWFDRAIRLISKTPGLDAAGRSAFGQIVRLQVQPAPTMVGALGIAGVDFSVSEADLTDWLNNPEFTPYPALSEALLILLDGRTSSTPGLLGCDRLQLRAFAGQSIAAQGGRREVPRARGGCPGRLEYALRRGRFQLSRLARDRSLTGWRAQRRGGPRPVVRTHPSAEL
jgi:hypothetical protein